MKKEKKIFNRNMLPTLLLVAVLAGSIAMMTGIFQNYIRKESIRMLEENVDSLQKDMEKRTVQELRQMEVIRTVIEAQETVEPVKMKNILSSFLSDGMVEEVFFLSPDNRILSKDGTYIENTFGLDFEEEYAKGDHSLSMTDSAKTDKRMIFQAMPIGEKGILYGVMKVEKITEDYKENYFGGNAELCLLEGNSPDSYMENWNKTPGSFYTIERLALKNGYKDDDVREDFKRGKSGIAVLREKDTREDVYFCYRPMGIADWMVTMMLPEKVVFKNSWRVTYAINVCVIIQILSISLYFLDLLWRKKREDAEKEKEMHQMSYMFKIQEILLDVHRNPEHMQTALEMVGDKLQAEAVVFIAIQKKKMEDFYSWYREGVKPITYSIGTDDITDELNRGENFIIVYNVEDFKDTRPKAYERLHQLGLYNAMGMKVRDKDGDVVGILASWNMSCVWTDPSYLECITMLFATTYNNIRNQKIIGKMASTDVLTGLLNRNSYERVLDEYDRKPVRPYACIYIDVNGLHEINNEQGHTAGDEMLCFVGATFQRYFGKENTYRIGGDEFLVFVPEERKNNVTMLLEGAVERIEKKKYHVSVGMEYVTDDSLMEQIIAAAEKKMYEDKKAYYQRLHKDGKRVRKELETQTEN